MQPPTQALQGLNPAALLTCPAHHDRVAPAATACLDVPHPKTTHKAFPTPTGLFKPAVGAIGPRLVLNSMTQDSAPCRRQAACEHLSTLPGARQLLGGGGPQGGAPLQPRPLPGPRCAPEPLLSCKAPWVRCTYLSDGGQHSDPQIEVRHKRDPRLKHLWRTRAHHPSGHKHFTAP